MEQEDDDKLGCRCWLRTVFACSGAMMVYFFIGVTESQSAVLLPQLKEKGSTIHVTPDEETWIASLGTLFGPLSAILCGPTIDSLGRKKGLLFFYINMGLGFGLIACATEVWHIYAGRCICSFAFGLEAVAVVYIAETCTEQQRSILLSLSSAILTIGISLTYFVGGYLPWRVASAIFSLGCFFYFVVQALAPESPAWLFKRGRPEAASASLHRLGRTSAVVQKELQLLELSRDEQESFRLKSLLEPTVWKPFVIMFVFLLLQVLTGVFHIMYYTIDFVERLGTTYDPLTVSIIISIARIIANSTLGIYFTAFVGRRFSTALSAILMTVAFVGAGTYEYLYRDTPVGQRPHEWLPITLVIVNIVSSIIAVTPLPWLMSGEVFPLRVRGSMSGASLALGAGMMFVFIKAYEVSMRALQIWGMLFVYAAASFVTIFFGAFVLPETQGKTLWEIEQGFLPKKRRVGSTGK